MKKFSWIAIFATAMVLTMGFVSCNNEPKDEPKAPVVYSITVTDGTATPTSGQKGTVITIKANDSAEGKMFDKWTTDSDDVTFSDATKHSTTFTMPEHDVNVTATYKDIPVWYDEAATTIYYYIESGEKLILNESSSYMFSGMSKLTSIETCDFDTSNVTNTEKMFCNCSELPTIYVAPSSDWSSSETLEVSTNMFNGCENLKGGAGTEYDAEKIDKTYARVDGGTISPGYFTVKN